MPKPIFVPSELSAAAGKVRRGEDVVMTVNSLVRLFGATKRGYNVVSRVKKALKKENISTSPDFSSVSLDEPIRLIKRVRKQQSVIDELRDPMVTFGMLKCVEHQRRLRGIRAIDLPALRKSAPEVGPDWSMGPQETIERAIILLSMPGIDHVPVFNDPRNVLGVISWDDFGIKSLLARDSRYVKCKEVMKPAVVVSEGDSVYDKKEEIVNNGYVIVKNDEGVAYAVVRSNDLASELLRMTEGFLRLQELESFVRNIIDILNLNQTDFDSCLPPLKRGKSLNSDDLEFTDYVNFFASPVVAKKIKKYNITAPLLKSIMDKINSTRVRRNAIVHFHPDENDETATKEITGARNFLADIYAEILAKADK
jgi:CBS domain-containing protein